MAVILSTVIGIGVLVAVVLSVAFHSSKTIILKDNSGEEFAKVEFDGDLINYVVEDQNLNEYAVCVIQDAEKILSSQKDIRAEETTDYLFDNIIEIRTNLDIDIQNKLKKAYEKNQELGESSCAMAITDLKGRLVAVFSNSTDFNWGLNKTYAASTIKPLSLFAPAIDSGDFTWSTLFVDEPLKKIEEADGSLSDWPKNADGRYTYKNVSIANAATFSVNTVSVKLLKDFGVYKSLTVLEDKYGINVDFEKNKLLNSGEDEILGNIALGYLYGGVSVVDMAGYYQVFANKGEYIAPSSIDEIISSSGSVYKNEYTSKRVMKPETAAVMNKMLQRVVEVGTGKDAKLGAVSVGGKTGTSSGNEDNWFVGFTPEYSCAVWHSRNVEGNISPKIFKSVFEEFENKVENFSDMGIVEAKLYCEKSGLLRGDKCIYCNKGYYFRMKNIEQCKVCG